MRLVCRYRPVLVSEIAPAPERNACTGLCPAKNQASENFVFFAKESERLCGNCCISLEKTKKSCKIRLQVVYKDVKICYSGIKLNYRRTVYDTFRERS